MAASAEACAADTMMERSILPSVVSSAPLTNFPAVPRHRSFSNTIYLVSNGEAKTPMIKKPPARMAVVNQGTRVEANLFIQAKKLKGAQRSTAKLFLNGRIAAIPRKEKTDYFIQWMHKTRCLLDFDWDIFAPTFPGMTWWQLYF